MNRRWIWSLLTLAVAAAGAVTLYQNNQARLRFVSGTTFAMNTFIDQKWFGSKGQKTYDRVTAFVTEIEQEISMHISNSDIALLNQKAGKEYVTLSPEVFGLLSRAKELSGASQGAFDLTIGPLVESWDITGLNPKVPSQEEIQKDLELINWEDLLLDETNSSAMLLREGMAVDLGAIAKGWACDQIRQLALEEGITSGYVSLGGNLMVIGQKPDGNPFYFGVRDPRGDATEYIGTVSLEGKTMATSGDYERYFEEDGVRYHHLLDPRTGYPADGGLISVSVISEDGALADFLSTTFFVLGREETLKHLEDDRYQLIVVDSDLNVYWSSGLNGNFQPNQQAEGYTFHQ